MEENFSEFARSLGLSRAQARKWRDAGMPDTNLAAAKEWIEARRAGATRGGKTVASKTQTLIDLKEQLLRANIKKTESEARLKDFEAEIAQKNLVSLDEAKTFIAEILGTVRVLLDSLPKATAVKANPSDPQLAEETIREAIDGVFKVIDNSKDRDAG